MFLRRAVYTVDMIHMDEKKISISEKPWKVV